MACAARRNITIAGPGLWRVTAITSRVGIETGWNRKRYAAARRAVTARTTDTSHVEVTSVIEVHAKTLQTRKGFQRTGRRVCVADGANRSARTGELLRVTSGTRQMAVASRQLGTNRIRITPVTERAR